MHDIIIVEDNAAAEVLDHISVSKNFGVNRTNNAKYALKVIENNKADLILILREQTSEITTNELLEEIRNSQMQTIFSLAKLAQSRDDDTGEHLVRVKNFCSVLARRLGEVDSPYTDIIDERFIENIENASPLHDIGKVGISDLILLKPGKLTQEEFETMKTHVIIGAETLKTVSNDYSHNEFVNMGALIARHHHERWDGNGYPDKLAGGEIPLAARIMAIADVYDALRTKRSYKESFSHEKSRAIILEGKGTQFDPVIVDAFEKIDAEFDAIWTESNKKEVSGKSFNAPV